MFGDKIKVERLSSVNFFVLFCFLLGYFVVVSEKKNRIHVYLGKKQYHIRVIDDKN